MIYFKIRNTLGEPLKKAKLTVTFSEVKKASALKAVFHKQKQQYEIKLVEPGNYQVAVSCTGYETAVRRFQYGREQDVHIIEIVLGKIGSKFLKLGARMWPIENPVEELVFTEKEYKVLEKHLKRLPQLNVNALRKKVKKDNSARLSISDGIDKNELKQILAGNKIKATALIFSRDEQGNELTLEENVLISFKAGITDAHIQNVLKEFNLSGKDRIIETLAGTRQIMVKTRDMLSWEYLEKLNQLSDLNEVVGCLPQLSVQDEFSYVPPDYLFPSIWSLHLANVPIAWELLFAKDVQLGYGNADVIVEVYDSGIQSNIVAGPNIRAVNNDFNQNVQGGSLTGFLATQVPLHPAGQHKIYHLATLNTTPVGAIRRYNQITFNNDLGIGGNSHGTCCAGIISAAAGIDPVFPGNGIAGNAGLTGVAPNTRLMGSLTDLSHRLPGSDQVLGYAAGLNPSWNAIHHMGGVNFRLQPQFNGPQNLGPGYSLSNHSHTWRLPTTFNQGDPFTNFIDALVSFGRNRRGAFILFAAGNFGRNMPGDMNVGQHEKVIAIAGSSINSLGFEERTSYSNHGNVPATLNSAAEFAEIDLCAPTNHHVAFDGLSNDGIHWFHNPPVNFGVFTTDLIGLGGNPGNTLSNATNSTQLTGGPYNAGVNIINVNAVAGFAAGNSVRLRNAAGTVTEYGHIAAVAGNQVTLRDVLKNTFTGADSIDVGPATHTDGFSGTSAACPFASGVLALVISANPKLSFWEVRNILKSTAEKIDLRMFAPAGAAGLNVNWTDASPAPNNIVLPGGLLNTNTAPTLNNYNGTVVSLTHANNPNRSLIRLNTVANLQVGRALLLGTETSATAFPTGNSVQVNNVAGFSNGQQIRIYDGPVTFLAIPSPSLFGGALALAPNQVLVGNAIGFNVGHVIQIGATGNPTTEIRTITAIAYVNPGGFGGHLIVTLGPGPANPLGPSNLANPHLVNTIVQLANQVTRNITGIAGNVITFSGAAVNPVNYPLAAGNPPVIIREVNTEIAVIREIDQATNTVVTNRLLNTHPANSRVVGGFIPHYSPALGSGRVDGYYAVKAALAYTHNERDLIIRNYMGDDGISATNPDEHPLNSPDIWIRNAAAPVNPIIGVHQAVNPLPGVIPNTYADAGDVVHQKPTKAAANSVYVRVGNRGTQQSFDYSVHIRLALKDADLPVKLTVDDYINGPTTAFPYLYTPLPNVAPVDTLFTGQVYNLNSGHPGSRTLADIHSLASNPTLGVVLPAGRVLNTLPTIPSNNGAIYVANLPVTGRPRLPFPVVMVRTTAAAIAGAGTLTLEHTRGLLNGQQILIGRPPDAGYERVTINAAPGMNTITFAPNLANPHAQGTFIIRLENITTSLSAATAAAAAGAKFSVLNVVSADGFKTGNHILSGEPGAAGNRVHRIVRIVKNTAPALNQLVIEPALAAIMANTTTITQIGGQLKTFALAEVTPHDGALAGNTPNDNNNVSYKEINFGHDVLFRDGANAADLPVRIQVATSGATLTTNFRIVVRDAENFATESIIITATRKRNNNTFESETFQYNSATPAWEKSPVANTWFTINVPQLTSNNNPAAGNQTDIYFSGNFQSDNNFTEAKITVNVQGNDPHPLGAQDFITATTYTGTVFSNGALPDPNSATLQENTGMPALAGTQMVHAFADMTNITQTPVTAYGIVDENQFRLTSMFTATGMDIMTYAPLDSIVFMQRNTVDGDTINLVLRPIKQPEIGFSRVKYFIFRGLLKDDILDAVDPTKLKLNAPLQNNAHFIDSVNKLFQEHNPAPPNGQAPVTVLGWDNPGQSANDLLDDYFFNSQPDHQLPVVKRGMTLGRFKNVAAADRYGFEIVLSEGAYPITLQMVRAAENILDLSPIAAETPEKIARREEILNYIDPAAFYGMHYLAGLQYPVLPDPDLTAINTNTITRDVIYTTVVSKFATRNTVYLDVRNENGYSYNYYDNYTQRTGPDIGKSIKIGTIPPGQQALLTQTYQTTLWPVIVRDNATSPQTNPERMSALYVQLSTVDNGNPVAYFEYGNVVTGTPDNNFADEALLLDVAYITNINALANTITVTGDISTLAVGDTFNIISCLDIQLNNTYRVTAKAGNVITVEPGTLSAPTMPLGGLEMIHFKPWTKPIGISYPNIQDTVQPDKKLNISHVLKIRYFRQMHELGKPITNVSLATRQFTITGLLARILQPGDSIIVAGSTPDVGGIHNNSVYTIAANGVMQIGSNTQITVVETIPTAFCPNNGQLIIKNARVPAQLHFADQKFGSLNAITRQFPIAGINLAVPARPIITVSGDIRHYLGTNTTLRIVGSTNNNNTYTISTVNPPVLNGVNTDITVLTAPPLNATVDGRISIIALPWRSDQPTQWINGFDFRFTDTFRRITNDANLPQFGFEYMGQTGLAIEQSRIIFYNTPLNFFKPPEETYSPGIINFNGGTSSESSFWGLMQKQNQRLFLNATILKISTGGTSFDAFPVFNFEDDPLELPSEPANENFLALCITRAEFELLKLVADQQLVPLHDIYLMLRREQTLQDMNNVNYRSFEIAVSGFKQNADGRIVAHEAFPATPVIVFAPLKDSVVFTSRDFANLENTESIKDTFEENLRLNNDAQAVYAQNVPVQTHVDTFTTALNNITNRDFPAMRTLVTNSATQLFTQAVSNAADSGARPYDDRQLYWARLHMRNAIRAHLHLRSQRSRRRQLLNILEERSRGFKTASFAAAPAGAKKILITGFDPFMLDPSVAGNNIRQSNPSGVIALRLHGQTISHGGKSAFIQSMIFPVRFADFDSRVVETNILPFLVGPDKVDMIITTSQDGGNYHNVDRWSSKFRHQNIPDNENITGRTARHFRIIPSGTSWRIISTASRRLAEFIETTLPYADMETRSTNNLLVLDQGFQSTVAGAPQNNPETAPGTPQLPLQAGPAANAIAVSGSGGSYLSNEIFYRVALMRTTVAGAVGKTGHLHVAKLQNPPDDFDLDDNQTLVTQIITILEDSLAHL